MNHDYTMEAQSKYNVHVTTKFKTVSCQAF